MTKLPQDIETELNRKYKSGEMRIVTEQARYNLDAIVPMLETILSDGRKKYLLNPSYQRRKRWNTVKKSRLIESFIMNVPLPPIFLYEVNYAEYEVMDGQQRLTSIYDFYKGKFALEGLEYWKELEGLYYAELPEMIKGSIDRRYLSSVILLEESAKDKAQAQFMKQVVFGRLNSGGELLTPQELRNALYPGKFNDLCIKLGENEQFRSMWRFPQETDIDQILASANDDERVVLEEFNVEAYRKMEDVELVLRFFAYQNLEGLKNAESVALFLDKELEKGNQLPDDELEKLRNLFERVVAVVYSIFEEKAFFLPKIEGLKDQRREVPAKTVYDGLMQAFAKKIEYAEVLTNCSEKLKKELYQKADSALYVESRKNKFLFDGRFNNWNNVKERMDYFESKIDLILSSESPK